ncbi:hypothetical protein Tco_0760592 [Tanacetum coccineum]
MPKEVKRMKNVPYASAVRSIMYAVRCTRPDVAFAQNMTSRFQQESRSQNYKFECYCNAGFETDRDDMSLRQDIFSVLNGGRNLAIKEDAFKQRSQKYTYSEVHSITNNFTTVIGIGGFGSVFRGSIGGNQVAVTEFIESKLTASGIYFLAGVSADNISEMQESDLLILKYMDEFGPSPSIKLVKKDFAGTYNP